MNEGLEPTGCNSQPSAKLQSSMASPSNDTESTRRPCDAWDCSNSDDDSCDNFEPEASRPQLQSANNQGLPVWKSYDCHQHSNPHADAWTQSAKPNRAEQNGHKQVCQHQPALSGQLQHQLNSGQRLSCYVVLQKSHRPVPISQALIKALFEE